MLISYILPTHDRPDRVARTLEALGALAGDEHDRAGAEVVVVDNASQPPPSLPRALANGLPVHSLRLASNRAAAARNVAAERAHGAWLVMLDDDSCPLDAGFAGLLADAPADVAAIGAEITLPSGER